jgi:hypothetical protein
VVNRTVEFPVVPIASAKRQLEEFLRRNYGQTVVHIHNPRFGVMRMSVRTYNPAEAEAILEKIRRHPIITGDHTEFEPGMNRRKFS